MIWCPTDILYTKKFQKKKYTSLDLYNAHYKFIFLNTNINL